MKYVIEGGVISMKRKGKDMIILKSIIKEKHNERKSII